MKKLNVIGIILVALFMMPVLYSASTSGSEIDVTAHKFDTAPTIDGEETEWETINDQDFTLRNPVDPGNALLICFIHSIFLCCNFGTLPRLQPNKSS